MLEENKVGDVRSRDTIDLREILRELWKKRKLFYITLPIAFVVSAFLILCVPRTYTTSVSLAPETDGLAGGGALTSLASSFLGTGSTMTSDAIYPTLYPDLMSSNDFIVGLFDVRVKSFDEKVDTTYYVYMKKLQKHPWWFYPIRSMKRLIPKKKDNFRKSGTDGGFDPFMMSKDDYGIAEKIGNLVKCIVDKKTDVITITVKDQDPLICATMADSVRTRLQAFITDYRTNKARIDMMYYERLTEEAKNEYEEAKDKYAKFYDANNDIVLETYKTKLSDLENDVQLTFDNYNTLNSQLQLARAKVQDKTPAFTIIQGASVPVKPSGPKRMLFVLGVMFLTFIAVSLYILRDNIKEQFK